MIQIRINKITGICSKNRLFHVIFTEKNSLKISDVRCPHTNYTLYRVISNSEEKVIVS